MNQDLIAELQQAVRAGSVPLPVPGESVDDFRFRTAHAGALVAIKWMTDQSIAAHEARLAQEEDTEGRPGDATVTSLPIIPREQNEPAGV